MKANEWAAQILLDDKVEERIPDILADLAATEVALFNAQQALLTEGQARNAAEERAEQAVAEVKRYADAYTQLDEDNAEVCAERDRLREELGRLIDVVDSARADGVLIHVRDEARIEARRGTCPECLGTGTWGETSDCPACGGTGKEAASGEAK